MAGTAAVRGTAARRPSEAGSLRPGDRFPTLELTHSTLLGYGRTGLAENTEAGIGAFQANRIRAWSDSRIPDAFKVRVWSFDETLDDVRRDAEFDAMVVRLKASKSKYSHDHQLGDGMPQPDRGGYITHLALDAALERHGLKRETSFTAAGQQARACEDMYTAIGLTEDPAVRRFLADWRKTD